ncbi:MAG: NADH-quinone oxidoreductase subunit N [Chitinophagia bacterium]|nr:NADH-quinone oxidoreductase subunit N [Chitinophagia bacterium]
MNYNILIQLRQELVLTALIFLLLFIKLGKDRSNESILNFINVALLINLGLGFCCHETGELFNGMFNTNTLIVFEKNLLNLAALIISMQSFAWLKHNKNLIEFYLLTLTSLLGMFFMISSGNLLMFYLGLEMSTIPLAAAANFDLTKRKSSEAAMKLILSSAFSSGILLLGISFLYGTTGTLSFSILPAFLNGNPLQIFAFILLITGFAFKISAVPFHLWTADVYEGAPVAVTSFLSVISKAAVLFTLVNILYKVFTPLANTWYLILVLLAAVTILIGNLFAIRQDNFKRFLAFSSIAQVGFILIGISGSSQAGSTSLLYFVLIYIFSNLAAFGVVSVVSALTGKENISDFKGFYKTNPFLSWVLTIALFSLAGVPPTAGFFGKLFLMMAGAAKNNYGLIIFASLNMVVSFFYYLKVVKAIFMEENEAPIQKLSIPKISQLAMYICMAGIIITGLASLVYDYIYSLSIGI